MTDPRKTGTDEFGIEQHMKTMVQIYSQTARATGRTNQMLAKLKDGDRVVFLCEKERDRINRLLKARKLDVLCIVIPTTNPMRLCERPPSIGRTIFDHSWVEKYYQQSINTAAEAIDYFQTQTSGHGNAHHETHEEAQLIWRKQS